MAPVEAREGYIPVTGGRVWYQIVGSGDGIPLLTVHGGPGAYHDYLEPLKALAGERPVIFYDQLGGGKSDRPDDPSLWRMERFAEELGQVRQALELEQVHLFGSSFGTMVALDYLLTQPAGVVSVIQVGPILSFPKLLENINRLYATLPEGMYEAMQRHEAAGTMDSEEYQQALKEYWRRYINRAEPKAEVAKEETATDESPVFGAQVYQTLWGPYELQVTGNLKDYDRSAQVGALTVPMVLICGRYDQSTPEETARYHSLVASSEFVIFEEGSHMPYVEEPDHLVEVVRDFLQRVEARLGE